MDGGLDDPLARMHRWEALRQKLAVSRGTRLEPVVDEVVDALAELVRRHGGLTLTVVVEDARAQAAVRLAWEDGRLVVNRVDPSAVAEPAEAEAPAGSAGGSTPSPDTAARLAELIRRDPWVLEDRNPWDRD